MGPARHYSGHRSPFLQELCLALRIDPIRSHTDTYDERHPQTGSRLHMAFYQLRGGPLLSLRHLKHELVMHLQQHPNGEPSLAQGLVDANHRDLDQVRRGPLERRVRGGALPERADIEVPVLELRDVAPPSEQRLHVASLARLGDGAVEPGAHAGETGEILRDELLRLLLRDAELASEREPALSVDPGEVDRLGARAHLRRNLLLGHAEDDRRRLAVDVPTLGEGT